MTKQRILLLGATGNTGRAILDGLLEYGKFKVEALIRPSSAEKPEVKKIAERGVKIVVADITAPADELVPLLKGVDVSISAIDAGSQLTQKNLATAAKKAGVKRFVPCAWITIAPVGGVMQLRDHKEEIYNHIKSLYLPYTIIDVGFWHQASFPRVPSGRLDSSSIFPRAAIHGDGQAPNILGDLRDIGRWTARIIDDDRTLNKFVFTCSEVLTENQLIALTEEAAGEKIESEKVSDEEVVARVHELRAANEKEPNNNMYKMMRWAGEYDYSKYVRGDNTPEYAKYLGYLDARELYPDFKPITYRDFLTDLVGGKIEKPQYNFSP